MKIVLSCLSILENPSSLDDIVLSITTLVKLDIRQHLSLRYYIFQHIEI